MNLFLNMNDLIQNNLVQLKYSDISIIRKKLLENQQFKCAICGKNIKDDSSITLDHQHKINKNQSIGENGAGLVRGVLCRDCNSIEGKITNALKRYKNMDNTLDKITFLYQLIEYYKKPLTNYIHPTEKESEKNISKRQYNKLKKIYNGKAKFPEYPKSKKLTVKLKELFNKYNINPYN